MIVSDSHRFVFIHNPKVAGMTIRTALMDYETRNNRFFEWQRVGHHKVQIDMAHITLQQLRRYFPAVVDQVAPYYKFGFVRHPYDRFFSALSQHLKLGSQHVRNTVLGAPDLFYRFAGAFAQRIVNDAAIESDFRLVHFRRQSDFFYFGTQKWADAVFRLEEPDAVRGTPAAAWLGDALAARRNPTEPYADTGYDAAALDPEARRVLDAFYRQDFERFGYSRLDPGRRDGNDTGPGISARMPE